MRKLLVPLAVAVMVAAACGGNGSDETDSAAFEDINVSECVKAPVTVGGISVLGHRVEGISDVKVCADAQVRAGIVPQLIEQPDCGNPCFTVEIRNFDVAGDAKIEISMKRDGKDVPPVVFDPQSVNPTSGQGERVCILGYGGPPDPCVERLTTPKNLEAAAGKKRVSLHWTASKDTGNDNLVGYEVWRSETGEPATFAYMTTVPETTHVDVGLGAKTSYWYYVVAIDADGNRSESSNIATTTTR